MPKATRTKNDVLTTRPVRSRGRKETALRSQREAQATADRAAESKPARPIPRRPLTLRWPASMPRSLLRKRAARQRP